MTWVFYAALAAILAALRDIFAKYKASNIPAEIVVFIQFGIGAIVLAGFSFFTDNTISKPDTFYIAIFISSLTSCLGSFCFFNAIKLSDISLMVPLRSITPVYLLFASPIILGDRISLQGVIGVLVLIGGILIINKNPNSTSILDGAIFRAKGTKYMLLCTLIFSVCAIFEKIGINASSPILFSMSEFFLSSVMVLLYLVFKKYKLKMILSSAKVLLPLGIMFGVMIFMQSNAMATGPLHYVVPIKRSGTVLSVLFGLFILREGNFRYRFTGSLIVILGAVIVGVS